jgi:glycosyltransferase involved in cell wall biosynthesis
LRSLYEASHIFLHPSRTTGSLDQEGVPNSMLEAMASGLPVVASGISGIPLAVEDGVTGRLVPEKDPDQLLAALLDVLRDAGRAQTMGERGRAKAEAELTWDAVAARYREGYELALSLPG